LTLNGKIGETILAGIKILLQANVLILRFLKGANFGRKALFYETIHV